MNLKGKRVAILAENMYQEIALVMFGDTSSRPTVVTISGLTRAGMPRTARTISAAATRASRSEERRVGKECRL